MKVLYPEGGPGDRAFSDLVFKGVTTAKTFCDFEEVEYDLAEDPDALEQALAEPPGPNELIITVGFSYEQALEELDCSRLEGRHVLHLDTPLDPRCEQVRSETYGTELSSAMAGVLAHHVAERDGTGIAVIAATEIPPVMQFVVGFLEGVGFAGGDTFGVGLYFIDQLPEVVTSAVPACEDASETVPFSNRDCARAMARYLYETQGVGVIFPVAGGAAHGVIEAAQEGPDYYTFGIDADQSIRGPEVVLASVRKRLDLSVVAAIDRKLRHDFEPSEERFGLCPERGRVGSDLFINPLFDEELRPVIEAICPDAAPCPCLP